MSPSVDAQEDQLVCAVLRQDHTRDRLCISKAQEATHHLLRRVRLPLGVVYEPRCRHIRLAAAIRAHVAFLIVLDGRGKHLWCDHIRNAGKFSPGSSTLHRPTKSVSSQNENGRVASTYGVRAIKFSISLFPSQLGCIFKA